MEHDEHDIQSFRQKHLSSLNEIQGHLLDICIGRAKPRTFQTLSGDYMASGDLDSLAAMVETELLAGMQKCLSETEETSSSQEDLQPYGIYLMEMTLTEYGWHQHPLSICLPKGERLVWYDGYVSIQPLDHCSSKWLVASLSGACRIFAALKDHSMLKELAMKRTGLVDPVNMAGPDQYDQWFHHLTQDLNDSQKEAVATIIDPAFEHGFFAIQGPPGTGKSLTCVNMIQALLLQDSRDTTLVTTPSNAAAANVALALFNKQKAEYGPIQAIQRITVFGENADPSVHFLNPIRRGEAFARLCDSLGRCNKNEKAQEALQKEFIAWLGLATDDWNRDWSMADLAMLCPYIELKSAEGRRYYSRMLGEFRLVCCTLNSAGSPRLRNCVRSSTVFLDEAGQCSEAEFYVAATFPGIKRMVVLGDPMQLPATVVDPYCKKAGYGTSWLAQVLRLHPAKVHLLHTQYRMDPAILAFSNREFYRGRIVNSDHVYGRSPLVENPFLFIDTNRKGREERDGFSWTNPYEVTVIKTLLFGDNDIVRFRRESRHGVRVIIIAPYKAQVALIQSQITMAQRCHVEVATVDSYQGQEADIVILSTVRTVRTGFTDDDQRLNVALTRAKRIVRVVGDFRFFSCLKSSSVLRRLAAFVTEVSCLKKSAVKGQPWNRPNWNQELVWKVQTTSRFHWCIQNLPQGNANVCWNTLFALAAAEETDLYARVPDRMNPAWYISALKGYQKEVRIVWIGKQGERPIIEAVFAGTEKECQRFVQTNPVPVDACIAKPGLAGVKESFARLESNSAYQGRNVAWALTNETQRVIARGEELPLSSMQLDSEQEGVARSPPPIIIESRSGTGKTLVLLQHAAYYADRADDRPVLFVTMSSRLRNKLQKEYEYMSELMTGCLPDIRFFSFQELLTFLVHLKRVQDFVGQNPCTYLGFRRSEKSYEKKSPEPQLVESEVGGVILGSLTAAQQRSPLSCTDYLNEKRSNVASAFQEDIKLRREIYSQYEAYASWKAENKMYDQSDVVLRLLNEQWEEVFSSAYLDEIQDLSYAAVRLICTLAGKKGANWVCAGDAAQMISPGCSFDFDGLKQTLLSVHSGIESRLSKVTQLLVNYRTTKDVLSLANEVLAVARRTFPRAIPFARTEIANTDLGLRVVLCTWEDALIQKVELGTNQALVFSSEDLAAAEEEARKWLGSHPFIMSALDSKGLEFDDVIVVFRYDRKIWDISSRRVASLRMLRELYVAITRAKRRVVVLLEKQNQSNYKFFSSLNCIFQTEGADLVLQEFRSVTSNEDWLRRAEELFRDENYLMASRCFLSAKDDGWYHFARAKDLETKGSYADAAEEYLKSLKVFGARREFVAVLRVTLAMAVPALEKYVSKDDEASMIVRKAIDMRPGYLSRFDAVRLALMHRIWEQISVEDLGDESLASLFQMYRGNPNLKVKVTRDSVKSIEQVLPMFAADFFVDVKEYDEAVRVFLSGFHCREAIRATKIAIQEVRKTSDGLVLAKVAKTWLNSKQFPSEDKVVKTLIGLFRSVKDSAISNAIDCINYLGRDAVLAAVDDDEEVDRLLLHRFSTTHFYREVSETLVSRYGQKHLEAVRWFVKADDRTSALMFVQKRVKRWNDDEWVELVKLLLSLPLWFFEESQRRKLTARCGTEILASKDLSPYQKQSHLRSLRDHGGLAALTVVCVSCIETIPKRQQSLKSSKRGEQRSKEEQIISEATFGNILGWMLPLLLTKERHLLLDGCSKKNSGNKISVALIENGLVHQDIKWTLRITVGAMKAKHFERARLDLILRLWLGRKDWIGRKLMNLQAGVVNEVVSCLLQLSIRLDQPDRAAVILSWALRSDFELNCVTTSDEWNIQLFEKLLHADEFEIALAVTKKALFNRKTISILKFLKAFNSFGWIESEGESVMPAGKEDVLSLLIFIVRIPITLDRKMTWFDVLTRLGPKVTGLIMNSYDPYSPDIALVRQLEEQHTELRKHPLVLSANTTDETERSATSRAMPRQKANPSQPKRDLSANHLLTDLSEQTQQALMEQFLASQVGATPGVPQEAGTVDSKKKGRKNKSGKKNKR